MTRGHVKVFVDGRPAGSLAPSAREQDVFLFTYNADCRDSDAVSLTMPVIPDPYDSMGTIHPIFEMNLPEGALRHKLELLFGKLLPDFDSLGLLRIVGRSQIGRLRYAEAEEPLESVPETDLNELLAYQGADALFESLLDTYARHSGISGMQPKVMVRSGQMPERITTKGTTHIVKSFDQKEFPELAANEYFCMRASTLAGLPTAEVMLSANRQMLAVKRFDLTEEGHYFGFEDFCVLSGMRSNGRYHSSYEALAARIAQYVSPENHLQALQDYFGMVALACAIKNGDAHLKNFGVLYDAPGVNVRLAPTYDMLSTVPYQPKDVLALQLNGSKAFPCRETLLHFASLSCGLPSRKAEAVLQRVAKGVELALAELRAYAKAHADFDTAASHLERLFVEGVGYLRGDTPEDTLPGPS